MPTPTEAITIDLNVPARMRDGVILRADIYRPAGEGRWPALLTRTPYGKSSPPNDVDLIPVEAARRGYVVIVQDTRGRSASDGEWYPFRCEADDGEDTIAWAASLPYCTGQVGTFGASYVGFTQWAAAVRQPKALKAMVPVMTWIDAMNGMTVRGGARELGTAAIWSLSMGIETLVRRYHDDPMAMARAVAELSFDIDDLGSTGYWALPLTDLAPRRGHDAAPHLFDMITSPLERLQASVAEAASIELHARVHVPCLHIAGWYDVYLGDCINSYAWMRARNEPTRLLIGPWTHTMAHNPVGQLNFGLGAQGRFLNLRTNLAAIQLRWFDRWLKAEDTGMLAEPPITLFVMGANVWRDEEEWPLARAVPTPWYLHGGGVLSPETAGDEEGDHFDYDPADPVPTHGGAVLITPEFPGGPYDQREIEARDDVVVYRSAPLDIDTEVTGPIVVHLWAISSAPDTDFVARLVDIWPDGRSYNLTDGIVRARYRDAVTDALADPIEPGTAYEYKIDLWATSNVFKAGHRIGLQVTSSCFPRWDRNPNTGRLSGEDAEMQVAHQEILHDGAHPSHVILPMIGPQ